MPDLTKYSDQEIIDDIRDRKGLSKQTNSMISKTVEDGVIY